MALYPTGVRVNGLRELNRDFGKLSKKLQREFQAEIRKLAEPAADLICREAMSEGYGEQTVSGIRAGTRRGGAIVRQSRGKTTGSRPDFGSIQYRHAFLPGAAVAQPIIERRVENWLEQITRESGLPLSGGGLV